MDKMPGRIHAMWCREEWFGEGPLGPETVAMNKRHVGYFSTDATGTEFIRADLVDELVKALEAQIRSHAMLCRAAGLTDQDHALGTSQARAALTRIKGDGK